MRPAVIPPALAAEALQLAQHTTPTPCWQQQPSALHAGTFWRGGGWEMNRGARNSVAAQDWALKRKQQMEQTREFCSQKGRRENLHSSTHDATLLKAVQTRRKICLCYAPEGLTLRTVRRYPRATYDRCADMHFSPWRNLVGLSPPRFQQPGLSHAVVAGNGGFL